MENRIVNAEELREQLLMAEAGDSLPVDRFAEWVFSVVPEKQREKMFRDMTTKFHAGAVNVEFKDDEELMGLYARWILETES